MGFVLGNSYDTSGNYIGNLPGAWSSFTATAGVQYGHNGSPPSTSTTMVIYVSSSTGINSGESTFAVTSANATVGATYTNNGNTFTVLRTIAGGTLLQVTGTGTVAGSTLTKTGGTGDATITFSVKTSFSSGAQGSATQPYRTITTAIIQQTDGGTRRAAPDWYLLMKGDSWTDEVLSDDGTLSGTWRNRGLDGSNLLIISAYDPANPTVVDPPTGGARPILRTPSSGAGSVFQCQGGLLTSGGNNTAIVGIEFYPYESDPNTTGRNLVQAGNCVLTFNPLTFFLMENCKITYYGGGFSPEGTADKIFTGVTLRRSLIRYCYGQGAETSCTQGGTCVLEENIFDSNGNPSVTGLSASINHASPAVVTCANGFYSKTRESAVIFTNLSSSGVGITAGTTYLAYNNNLSTFNISTKSAINGDCVLNGTTTVTGVTTSGFDSGLYNQTWSIQPGYGVFEVVGGDTHSGQGGTDGGGIPANTVITSIPTSFTVSGNTHSTTTVDGIASTAGIYVGSGISGTGVNATVTAVFTNSVTLSSAASSTNSGVTLTIVPNAFIINNAATATRSTQFRFIPITDFINTTNSLTADMEFRLYTPQQLSFIHQLYIGGTNRANQLVGPVTIQGNIVARDTAFSNGRSGGTYYDNSSIANDFFTNFGNPNTDFQTVIKKNVFLNGTSRAAETMGPNYQGDSYILSTTLLTENIVAHGNGASTAFPLNNGFSVTWSNNVVYDWGSGANQPFCSGDDFTHLPRSGGVVTASVTSGGTLYNTDASHTITGTGSNANNGNIQLTLSSNANIPTNGDFICWVTGMTGGSTINSVAWICYLNGSVIELANSSTFTVGTVGGSATLYYPVTDGSDLYGRFLFSNIAPHSGSGTGFRSLIVVAGGSVVALAVAGTDTTGSLYAGDPGQGYVTSDTVTASVPGTAGGGFGTGFVATIGQVSTMTNGGGNKLDPTSSLHAGGSFPEWTHPERDAGKYLDSLIGGSGHTHVDFINAAAAKWNKANWDYNYTANALNTYIRAGFGITNGGTTPPQPILMPQICM